MYFHVLCRINNLPRLNISSKYNEFKYDSRKIDENDSAVPPFSLHPAAHRAADYFEKNSGVVNHSVEKLYST